MSVSKTRPAVSNDVPANDTHTPRPLTLKQNIVLTLKVLGGLGLLGAALWAVELWTAVK